MLAVLIHLRRKQVQEPRQPRIPEHDIILMVVREKEGEREGKGGKREIEGEEEGETGIERAKERGR